MSLRQYLALAADLPEDAAQRVRSNAHRVGWTNWQGILGAMESAHVQHAKKMNDAESVRCAAELLADLKTLMAMRQMLPFRGVSRTIAEMPDDALGTFHMARGSIDHGPPAGAPQPARVVNGYRPVPLPERWFAGGGDRRQLDLTHAVRTYALPWQGAEKPLRMKTGRAGAFPGIRSVRKHRPMPLAGWRSRYHNSTGRGHGFAGVVGDVTFERFRFHLAKGVEA